MNKQRTVAIVVLASMNFLAPIANAHKLQWRAGDIRQVGYGHCSKGPCMRRTCWAPTKPHRHVRGKIRRAEYGPKECFVNDNVFGFRFNKGRR